MRKTFTWLSGRKRPPSEYEELSTALQWYAPSLVQTTIGSWSQDSTKLDADWEAFRDPSQLYYRTYVALQDGAERQLDAVFSVAREAGFAGDLAPEWRAVLPTLVGAMSFAEWGVAMAHQQVQRFCLGPTIGQSAQLQVMDKLRSAERDLEWYDLVFGADVVEEDHVRTIWTEAPEMQPLRRYIEEALGTQDWGEVIVAVNLALLGVLQPFLRTVYVGGGRRFNDFVTAALGTSTWNDAKRHAAWTDAFVQLCLERQDNQATIAAWLDSYIPRAVGVIESLAAAFPLEGVSVDAVANALAELRARLDSLNIELTERVAGTLQRTPETAGV